METEENYQKLATLLTETKPVKITLTGYSMFPTLIHKDLLRLNYDTSKITDDEIVLFTNNAKIPRIHRYLAKLNRTKADSSIFLDEPLFEIIARLEKTTKSCLHFYRKFKFDFLYHVPKELQLVTVVISGEYALLKSELYINDLNFKYLFKWLQQNKLTCIFSSQITDWKLFPDRFVESLQKDFLEHQGNFTIQNKAYAFIAHFFELIDIPMLPFKGIDFTSRYYSDQYQRQMYDIDIMIEEKNLDIVINNMRNNPCFEFRSLSKYLKHHHHFQVILKNFNYITKINQIVRDYTD